MMELHVRVEDVKEYLRIDGNEEDELLISFILSAQEYLQDAGVPPMEESYRYKLAVMMLVTQFYENRGIEGAVTNLFGLQQLILQLKVM